MQLRRSLTAGVTLTSLLLMAVAPASAATETTTTSKGSAVTTSVPLLLEAAGETVELGRTELVATTDDAVDADAPWSGVALTLADVAGTPFGEVAVASDGTTTSDGATIGESTAVGAVTATAADLVAIADDTTGTATAALTSLTTEATVLDALDLSATISNVVTTVDDTGAAARHSLAVTEIDLGLDNVLGDVLAGLPLSDLLALADELGVVVPNLDAAGDVVTATEDLVSAVLAAAATTTAVETTVTDLLDAEATLATLTALLDLDLVALLASDDLPDSCSSLTDLPALTTCVQGVIDAQLVILQDAAIMLQDAVDDYLAAVAAAAQAALTLEGISDSIDELIANLLAVDLLALGDIDVTQQVRAVGGQEDASSASTTCQLTSISVLGGDAIDLSNCDASGSPVVSAVELVSTTLQTVLETVGGVDAEGDLVQLDLFGTSEDTVTTDGDTTHAISTLEVLSLAVPDITIDPCDVEGVELACALGLTDGLDLDDAIAAVDEILTTAHSTVTGALTPVLALGDDLLTQLGLDLDVSAAEGVQSIVDTALDQLLAVLNGLGVSQGIEVPGVRVVVDPELVATHQVVTAAAGPGDPAPAPNPAPDPDGDPTLPNTGGGAALLAILSLGAGVWLFRRRELQ